MTQHPPLDAAATVVRSDTLLTAEVDGELMAMSVDRGLCYGLDQVGTRIWALLAAPRRIDELCALLVAEYAVDLETCRRDVVALLAELRREGLVTVRAAP